MTSTFKRFWVEEDGAEITEYALLAVILAVAVLTGGPFLSSGLVAGFQGLATAVTNRGTAVAGM